MTSHFDCRYCDHDDSRWGRPVDFGHVERDAAGYCPTHWPTCLGCEARVRIEDLLGPDFLCESCQ